MSWMPPAPGWLGDLIDQVAEEAREPRRLRARRRLLDLGVPAADVELACSGERNFWRVVRKWQHRHCGGVIRGALAWKDHPILGFLAGYVISKGAA